MRWLCLLLIPVSSLAQTVQYSPEEKFSLRSQDLEVIGKARGLVYVHLISRAGSEVVAFRPDMKQQWRRPLSFGHPNEEIEHILQRDSGFIVFYSWREKNVKTTAVHHVFLDLAMDTIETRLDTFMRSVADAFPDYQIVQSEDKTKLLCYYTKPELGEGETLSYAVLDDQLRVLVEDRITMPPDARRSEFEAVLVSNEGEVFVVINEYADPAMLASKRFWVLRSTDKMVVNDMLSVTGEGRWMNNLSFKMDNENNHLAVSGFYSLDQRHTSTAEGVMFVVFDLTVKRKISESYVAFAPEFIAKIKGTRQSRATERLYTFVIDDIILRKDGGAIIVAESYHKTIRPRNSSVTADPYGPYTFGEASTTYYFEELMVLSMSPSGDLQWKNVLIKSQVSSGDNGRFSSYITMNTGTEVSFIFNDEIRYRTNLVQYIIDPGGSVEREIIFNARKYDLFLMPQMGKQVSAREMVIPSYKKGKLRFVKLNY